MKARITQLKAPWPAGAKVGDVVELPVLPAWAQGKCTQVDDGEVATIEFVAEEAQPEKALVDPSEVARQFRAVREEALRRIEEAKAAFDAERAELQAKLDAQAAELEELRAAKDSAEARAASLQAKLDAAETGEGKADAALQEAEKQAATERVAAETKAKGKK